MGKIINFKKRFEQIPGNLITSSPWEFRRAERGSKYFIQILRSHWDRLEDQMKELSQASHFVLKGGMAHTIHAIYSYRNSSKKMREVYYLAGLMDCMINRTNPLLRTDLIRDIYKKVISLKKLLNINWYGPMDQVLFPIDIRFYNQNEYGDGLSKAETMKELYLMIREGTDEMFDILSSEYIFFTPSEGV